MTIAPQSGLLGAWSGDDLADTARHYLGIGADAGFDRPVRFLSAVAKLASARLARTRDSADPPQLAVFLLSPIPPVSVRGAVQEVPILDNGLHQLSGRVWFVAEVAFSGRFLEIDRAEDAEIFGLVCGELDCGEVPAVVVEPRTSPATIRFYPSGLGRPDECRIWPVDQGEPVTLQQIVECTDDLHRRVLVTPGAQATAGKLWGDPTRFWPIKDAEGRIQSDLLTALKIRFPTCDVRSEQSGIPGRLDVEIDRSDPSAPGTVAIFAVVELKVLRSFWSTGDQVSASEILDWVESGVRQAATYRSDRHALAAALFCFDMRRDASGERCFDHVRELAERHDVMLRLWYLFSSAAAYRDSVIV